MGGSFLAYISERVVCMRVPVFTGTCPALVTPFDHSGAIDYDMLAIQIEAQIAAGVDAVCICGTTGESATLSEKEHLDLVEFCVNQVSRRVKVIAGTGSNNTAKALYLTQHAQSAGADAALLVTPYYNKTTQRGLVRHYEHIAERANIPLILYNVPGRTGLSFSADTYHALSKVPTINGVKEASGDISLLTRLRSLCGDDFYVWSGNDDQVVPMMALGAVGVISVAANLIPGVMVELTHLCLNGDYPSSASVQLKYSELISALFCEVNPIPIKAAMKLCGTDSGVLRLPLCEISDDSLIVLRQAMLNCGIPVC